MKTLTRTQHLPIKIEEAWDFFSNPLNLKEITPDYMGFEITNQKDLTEMHPGMIITYIVKPLLNIPMNWVTEITQVKKPWYFVDSQLSGPYAYWHHQHFFRETATGVEMKDIVNYAAPFGWIGRGAEYLIVNKKVVEIFDFRYKKLNQIFQR
ncbi:MAG: SRPBCC family protein [Bacteroidales bacterium]|nr:SRPBCC family protein [Bacteroidales bacterium]